MKCIDVENLPSMYFPGAGEVSERNTEHASFFCLEGKINTNVHLQVYVCGNTERKNGTQRKDGTHDRLLQGKEEG